MAIGPNGSSIQPSDRHKVPCAAAGTTSVTAIPPAFPDDALSPCGSGSTTVTRTPLLTRWYATARPIIPAPTTTMCMAPTTLCRTQPVQLADCIQCGVGHPRVE